MECSNIIEATLNHGNIKTSLSKGSSDKEVVIDLQRTLFELGFRKELKWDNYQADGDYGAATANAVATFAKRNGIQTDGKSVNKKLARLILQRHDFLPDMYILWTIHKSDLRTKKYISKGTRMSITAIQVLLNELGYGKQLQFSKYGADGIYGKSTRKAFISYANDNGIESDGDLLTRPVVNLMLKDINKYYGNNWSDLAIKNLPNKESPLRLFQGSRFRGKPCRADVQFLPSLKLINSYAEQADVYIHVTSSFRTTTNVKGAIVKPSKTSNHLVGHGIDMNIIYGNNQWANSAVLGKYPKVPAPVKQFIKSIIDDSTLRWGGKFRSKDPVHIDDNLYHTDSKKWHRRYQAMQKAVQLGK